MDAVTTLHEGKLLKQFLGILPVMTSGTGFTELNDKVGEWISKIDVREGLLICFCRHTSASLTIQENADPSVRRDLLAALERMAPRGLRYSHDTEGPDDMPAHIRSMLTAVSLQVPVLGARLALGVWQAIYLIEHRAAPHRREIVLQFIGSVSP